MKDTYIIDFTPLEKAISSLEKAVLKNKSVPQDEFVRDASIQRFEYTYELCGKFLRRYLQLTEQTADEVKEMSFPNLIRTASERGLLANDWTVWKIYREKRNITSHTYDEKKAQEIMAIIPDFLQEAQALLITLKNHTQAS